MTAPADRARVAELLGREPQGQFEIVVRNAAGDPVVLKNAPLLADGTPMPTRYWLIDPAEIRRIGRIESSGGVNRAEAAVDPAELAAAHARYAAERDADISSDFDGHRPYGGVGGTRIGVKCLHAHWAYHLAGGNDPVGRWIEQQLTRPATRVEIDATTTTLGFGDHRFAIPWGSHNLTERWLEASDPPAPEDLTNALGAIDDYLSDVAAEFPEFARTVDLSIVGPASAVIARVEAGDGDLASTTVVAREDIESLFRLVTSETAAERAENPGLARRDVSSLIAALCIVLSIARRLRVSDVEFVIDRRPEFDDR